MEEDKINSAGDFSIGNFEVFPSKNLLVENSNQIHVTPKVLSVLTLLAKRKGETVSKDEIMKSVWGDVVISDMVLSKAISDLRKALGDSAKKQHYIKTVSKKGYVLVKDVQWSEKTQDIKQTLNDRKKSIKTSWSLTLLASLIVLAIIFGNEYQEDNDDYAIAPNITNITADTLEQRHPRFSSDGKFVA